MKFNEQSEAFEAGKQKNRVGGEFVNLFKVSFTIYK